jgi:UDP-2,4-diacetamido-2,4,6-trideoxy-beta-L-altropyranose hydrolase
VHLHRTPRFLGLPNSDSIDSNRAGEQVLPTPSSTLGTLLIRADANSVIGTGHVMRCLALAQAWQDAGGMVAFACGDLPESVQQRLAAEDCAVHKIDAASGSSRDLEETRRLAESISPRWLVLDGYKFGPDFQLTLRDVKWRLMVIDDDGRHEAYHADVLLNQNAGAAAVLYGRHTHGTRTLLGCRYAMLRREFRKCPKKPATNERVNQILLTLGGADQGNATEDLLPILSSCRSSDCQIQVVIGPANPDVFRLRDVAAKMQRVVLHVSPTNLPQIMASCDLAVTAAGSSVYELGYLGVPMLLAVTAENQRPIAAALDQLGAAVRLNELSGISSDYFKTPINWFIHDPTARAECAARFQQLVDGQGAARVVALLGELSGVE